MESLPDFDRLSRSIRAARPASPAREKAPSGVGSSIPISFEGTESGGLLLPDRVKRVPYSQSNRKTGTTGPAFPSSVDNRW